MSKKGEKKGRVWNPVVVEKIAQVRKCDHCGNEYDSTNAAGKWDIRFCQPTCFEAKYGSQAAYRKRQFGVYGRQRDNKWNIAIELYDSVAGPAYMEVSQQEWDRLTETPRKLKVEPNAHNINVTYLEKLMDNKHLKMNNTRNLPVHKLVMYCD